MTAGSKYVKIIECSDADNCFIGSCPELFYGGCHGSDERKVFDELCKIIEEMVQLYEEEGKQLPPPISGKELVNKLQIVA